MKYILLCLCFLCVFPYQLLSNTETSNDKPDINDSIFASDEIPEEYKDYSAVIIARYGYYEVLKAESGKLSSKYINRFRIKLQDKKSVDEYSTFSFADGVDFDRGFYRRNKVRFMAIFNVIKSNGDVREIDLSEAIDENLEMEANELKRKKIAIPNLEVGDIIDYSIGYIAPYKRKGAFAFNIEYFYLQRKYPSLNVKLKIDLGKYCYISAKSKNGAPELMAKNLGEEVRTYEFSAHNIPRYKEEPLLDAKSSLPYVKFQINYARYAENILGDKRLFMSFNPQIKTRISQSETAYLVEKVSPAIMSMTPWAKSANACISYLKRKGFEKGDQGEAIKLAYYYMKHLCTSDDYPGKYVQPSVYTMTKNELYFYAAFSMFLKRWKVPFNVYVANTNLGESMKDLLFYDEFERGLYLPGDDVFITGFSMFGHYGYIPMNLQNKKASVYDYDTRAFIKEIDLPYLSADINLAEEYTNVSIDLENDKIKIAKEFTLRGNSMFDHISFIDYRVYYEEISSNKELNRKPMYSFVADRKSIRKKISADMEESKQKLNEQIESQLEDFYGEKIKPYDYKIIQYGAYDLESGYKYRYSYDVDQSIIKTDDEIIFNLENILVYSLIDADLKGERKSDIYLKHKGVKKEIIKINAPEGYKIADHSFEEAEKKYAFGSLSLKLLSLSESIIEIEVSLLTETVRLDKSEWNNFKEFYSDLGNVAASGLIFQKL